ncbi:uncharacterized protein LOC142544284 [Primulina tabacum]|uniref:uncharacterized protein LOC142544284 n=1 Tax=Primulina tabacum TaxID=48773 RepID=UPI003F5A0C9B
MARTESRLDNMETHKGNMGATMKSLETQIGQLDNALRDQHMGQFSSNKEVNPKEQCKAVTLRSGKELEVQSPKERVESEKTVGKGENEESKAEVEVKRPPILKPTLPYPQRFKKKNLDDQELELGEVKPTTITLQLVDRSLTYPRGIVEDVLGKVDKFIFPADFVILDMEEDRDIPLIFGRPFLATGKALIDVHKSELTLRVGTKDHLESCLIGAAGTVNENDWEVKEQLMDIGGLQKERTNNAPLEKLNGDEKSEVIPSSPDLKELTSHLFYEFLGYNQIVTAPEDLEKTTFTCPYGTFAFRLMPFGLFNAPATFQRRMMAIFADMAFEKIKKTLVTAPIMIVSDWKEPFELMCDASDYAVCAVLGQRREKMFRAIYYAMSRAMSFLKKGKDVDGVEAQEILEQCLSSPYGGHFGTSRTAAKVLQSGFLWPNLFKDRYTLVKSCDRCQRLGNISRRHELPLTNILEVELFDVWGIDFMGPFPHSFGNYYILLVVDYVSKWVEAIATNTNDACVVAKFVHKNIFTKFGTLRAVISDEGTHFCNKIVNSLWDKYNVKHKVALAYQPQ